MPSQKDPESDTTEVPKTVPFRRVVLKWGERLFTLAVLGFALYRLGPQLGALTGVGPSTKTVRRTAWWCSGSPQTPGGWRSSTLS